MIGNDVIDLALARKESNWQRRGFLQKLFTQAEQRLILDSANPELMVWNLWSRKEAAYKIYNRETSVRAFIPLQLICNFDDSYSGTVIVKGKVLFTKTSICEQQIHTIAVSNREDFTKIISLDHATEILKKSGIPFLADGLKPVSISHHGRFKAVVTLNQG